MFSLAALAAELLASVLFLFIADELVAAPFAV